jgi:hypothetical protein
MLLLQIGTTPILQPPAMTIISQFEKWSTTGVLIFAALRHRRDAQLFLIPSTGCPQLYPLAG